MSSEIKALRRVSFLRLSARYIDVARKDENCGGGMAHQPAAPRNRTRTAAKPSGLRVRVTTAQCWRRRSRTAVSG